MTSTDSHYFDEAARLLLGVIGMFQCRRPPGLPFAKGGNGCVYGCNAPNAWLYGA